MRIYVPPNSSLQAQDGWQPRGKAFAFGRAVWSGIFTLSFGQTHTITLSWKVPAAASRAQNGWQYHYLIQRQAGTLWNVNLQLTLPSCAVVTNNVGADKSAVGAINRPLRSGFVGADLSRPPPIYRLAQTLNEDLHLGVDYACK